MKHLILALSLLAAPALAAPVTFTFEYQVVGIDTGTGATEAERLAETGASLGDGATMVLTFDNGASQYGLQTFTENDLLSASFGLSSGLLIDTFTDVVATDNITLQTNFAGDVVALTSHLQTPSGQSGITGFLIAGLTTSLIDIFAPVTFNQYDIYTGGASSVSVASSLPTQANVSTVPLPASALLLVGAFAGLAGLRSRK